MKETFNTLTAKKIIIEEKPDGELLFSFSPELVVRFVDRKNFYDFVDFVESILPRKNVDLTNKYIGHTVGKYDRF